MSDSENRFEELLRRLGLNDLPTYQQILESMDPLLWALVLLLTGAVILGVFFALNSRYRFRDFQEAEAAPEILLARLKQDPTYLTPASIINRLGADTTLQLLEYGDQITVMPWRSRWNRVREGTIGVALGPECVWPRLRSCQLLPVRRCTRTGQHAHPPHSANP